MPIGATLTPAFEVDAIAIKVREVFDAVHAKLLFEADVFWARESIGAEPWRYGSTPTKYRESIKNAVVELELL